MFEASLTGTSGGASDDRGIFSGSGGAITRIVREGQAAPDGNGTFSFFGDVPALNGAGQAAFEATFAGTSGGSNDNSGIFRGSGGAITRVAREGQAAPDSNGTFSSFNDPALNDAGQAVFKSFLVGTSGGNSDNSGIFRGSGGAITQVAREGQAAPDGNGTFSFFSDASALNSAGQAAFDASLTGTSGGNSDDSGIFRGSGGVITQVAREGQAAPNGNGAFSSFNDPALNGAGQAAFDASLTGTSGGTNDNSGIFRGSGGAITRIAREGQAAPDGNGTFASFNDPALNGAGQVAFEAFLTGTSESNGIFRGSGGVITQVARDGQAAPDGNGVFSNFLDELALNDAGQVVFEAFLTGTSGGTDDDNGIFLSNGIDIVQVARQGQALAGSTISALALSTGVGANGGQRSGLNDAGQVTYKADLANGNDVIVRFTIPDIHWIEPGSGFWITDGNWTQNIEPHSFHDTFIDPDTAVTVTVPSFNKTVKSLPLGGSGPAVATLRIDGFGDLASLNASTITTAGELVFGNGRVFTAPSLISAGVIRGTGTVDADLTNQVGGEVRVAAGESLVVSGSSHVNAGVFEAIGGEIRVIGGMTNATSTGLITGRDATLRFNGGLINHGAVAFSTGISDVHGDIFNTGSVIVSGNAIATFYEDVVNSNFINVSIGSTAVFFGGLFGNGVSGAGAVFLEGDTRPGASPGTMSFGGDVNFGVFSRLDIELGGPTAGTEFDEVSITGDATLAGTLDVSLIEGFNPQLGDAFKIFTANRITGAFDTENLPALGGIFAFDISYSPTDVVLNVIVQLLIGDANNDGQVTGADLIAVQQNFGDIGPFDGLLLGDANDDGQVTGADLIAVQQNFGNVLVPASESAPVPEPTSLALLLATFGVGALKRSAKKYSTSTAMRMATQSRSGGAS